MSDIRFTEGDPDLDFFEQNPHWKYLDSTKKLLKQVDKETASKIRWAVFLMLDPSSKFFRYGLKYRFEIVVNNYLDGANYFYYDETTDEIKSDEFQYIIDAYPNETMSKTKRDYYTREESYRRLVADERESTNLKLRADVQLKLAKIYEQLEKIKEEFLKEEEEEKKKARGVQQPGILFNF